MADSALVKLGAAELASLRMWDSMLPKIMDYGLRILGAVLIFLVGKLLIRFVLRLLQGAMGRARFDPTLIEFSSNLINLTLLFMTVLMAANTLGFQTTSFLAVLGAAGLAIGLALKGSLDNVASGVLVVSLRQIHVGDYISIESYEGFVESIRVFNTTLRTRDNKRIIIPNSNFSSSVLVNYSSYGLLRKGLEIGISYADDIPKAKTVMLEVISSNPLVKAEPAPFVGVKLLNESSVDFDVLVWVDVADYWKVKWELTEAIKIALEAHGITIPFPQRDVHFYPASGKGPIASEDQSAA